MNGRGSGTRDEWIAASYIASQLRRWGLEPLGDDGGFVQAVEIARTQVTVPPVLTAGPLRLTHGKEIIVQGLGALRVSGPLVKFRSGATVPPGAVVLMPDGPISRDTFIATAGAAAVLTIENAQVRSRWEVQAARPILLPGRIVALPVRDRRTLSSDADRARQSHTRRHDARWRRGPSSRWKRPAAT